MMPPAGAVLSVGLGMLVELGCSMSICGGAQHFYVQSLHTQFGVQEMVWEGPGKRSGWQRQEFTAFSGKVHHNYEDRGRPPETASGVGFSSLQGGVLGL